MKRATKKTPAKGAIQAYKGFDANLSCRGFQFEVGGSYEQSGTIKACENGFHSCECPFDVWNYYPASNGNRFALVEASGEIARHEGDSKIASAHLRISAELSLPDFIKRGVEWLVGHAKTTAATGNSGHAAATGNSGHAAATGYSGHAAATGDYGHAAATGYRGHAAATGNSGHAAATGNSGHAAATGNSGHAAATGDRGHAAATGYRGHAAATGDSGHAAVKGKNAIAASLGVTGSARAEDGGAIMLARYDDNWNLIAVFSSLVGENGIEAGKTYRLGKNGPEQVQ